MIKWFAVLAFIAAAPIGLALAQTDIPRPIPIATGMTHAAECQAKATQQYRQLHLQCNRDAACLRRADALYANAMSKCGR